MTTCGGVLDLPLDFLCLAAALQKTFPLASGSYFTKGRTAVGYPDGLTANFVESLQDVTTVPPFTFSILDIPWR